MNALMKLCNFLLKGFQMCLRICSSCSPWTEDQPSSREDDGP